MKITAIIFDHDGTLYQTGKYHESVVDWLIVELKLPKDADELHKAWDKHWDEQIRQMESFRSPKSCYLESLNLALNSFGLDSLSVEAGEQVWEVTKGCYLNEGMYFPDVSTGINVLHDKYGLNLGILTNFDISLIQRSLKRHDAPSIENFNQNLFDPSFAKAYKPRLEIFLSVCTKMHVHPDEVLFVGDLPTIDIAGANKAGLKTALIHRPDSFPDIGVRTEESVPNMEISSLFDLQNWIEQN